MCIEWINKVPHQLPQRSNMRHELVNYRDYRRYTLASLMARSEFESVGEGLDLELEAEGEMTEDQKKEVTYRHGIARATTARQMVSFLHEVVGVLTKGRKSFCRSTLKNI